MTSLAMPVLRQCAASAAVTATRFGFNSGNLAAIYGPGAMANVEGAMDNTGYVQALHIQALAAVRPRVKTHSGWPGRAESGIHVDY
jgi:hypothetical protein